MSPPPNKLAAYRILVEKRKICCACDGLTNPSACAGGAYDSDHIGPWSQWQGRLDSDLMVVGQDWGDVKYFVKNRGHEDADIRTNTMLCELLKSVGLNIQKPSSDDCGGGAIFLTNAILCLKQDGGLQGGTEPRWFEKCGFRFLRPTIEIVRPKLIVALGQLAYWAIANEYRLEREPFRDAVDRKDGFELPSGMRLFPVYYCGARILNTHRRRDQQLRTGKRSGMHWSAKDRQNAVRKSITKKIRLYEENS